MVPFLLDTVITPGGEAAAETATTTTTQSTGLFGTWMADHPVMLIVIYCVVLLAIMYFLSIRPTQKKEKQLAELRNAIEIGDSIVTNSGFYGKVVDMTYDCLIVEFGLNRGVRIPVAKTEVFGKAEPNMSNEAPVVEEAPKKKGLFKRG
ncbi:preprotein translocase subunit YajC [Anaerotignum sp.]|nr:preprotein translocase subunit YajC [Anaerotignum sp.]